MFLFSIGFITGFVVCFGLYRFLMWYLQRIPHLSGFHLKGYVSEAEEIHLPKVRKLTQEELDEGERRLYWGNPTKTNGEDSE
jgi:hypothetical protein